MGHYIREVRDQIDDQGCKEADTDRHRGVSNVYELLESVQHRSLFAGIDI